MKKFIYSLSLLLSAMTFTGCSDFFDPDTDDQLNGEDYISSDTEMYTGFLGIMTKLQAIGDKEILLTDTRGECLEITSNSTPDIISLYNYDEDLHGNPYANPAAYYEVVMACNDYLIKMKDYGKLAGVDPEVWADLVSCTIRVKAWTYKTIAEIYGEAVWFDSAVTELTDLTPANGFELLPIEQVMDRALNLMENGWNGVSSDRDINWIAWLDPDNVTSIADSDFRQWNHMVPAYEGVYSELLLWKGAAVDAVSGDDPAASRPYYQKVCDLILPAINNTLVSNHGNPPYWIPSAATKGKWRAVFSNPSLQFFEIISVIIYDYAHNQNNSLNNHFLYSDRNEYLLRPSQAGMDRWSDKELNPGGGQDTRFDGTFRYPTSAQPVIYKYSVNSRTSMSDVHIITYRATQYHFYLMEALNHLNRFNACAALINNGVSAAYVDGDKEWDGFTVNWTGTAEWGSFRYPNTGVRGCLEVPARNIVTDPSESMMTDAEAIKTNDMQILDEVLIEFSCEGRTYPWMNRMALRYGDLSIVADRVAPKYVESGKDATVRARILDGANYVHYDLKVK